MDGTPGMGKSRLIFQAVRELVPEHPAGCLFLDLRAHATSRPLSPRRALARMLRAMGGDGARIGDSEDELTAARRSATSDLRLLVLEDAVDARQVRPQLPSGPGSTVIMSSRRRMAGLDATRRISLDPLLPTATACASSGASSEQTARSANRTRPAHSCGSATGRRSPCGSWAPGSRPGPIAAGAHVGLAEALTCMADAHLLLDAPHEARPLLREAAALAADAKDLLLGALTPTRLGTAVHQEAC
ncbi:hypothetical protein [Streptomyces sp. NPDC002232]|uniref:hypothetical protein n=1 Tax=Streptomyces sp. NPDC002232 TaxID=3364640 RepID=UPI0036A879BA